MTDRCEERKDQSKEGVETEEGERKKDRGEKGSGRGREAAEGEAHGQVAIGEEEEDRQSQIVASRDVGQRNKGCRERQNQQRERQRDREIESKRIWSDKKDKTNAGKGSREKPEKRSENPSLSLSPRVSHGRSAASFCRILSPLHSLTRANVVVESKSPSPPRSELANTLSLTLPIRCYTDGRPIGFV